jgi:glycosyltransferase involved in cell wall biosynthesis
MQAVTELGDRLDYRGPLWNSDKNRFYCDIDIFIFPTLYANEAQPTVIFEAQAAGAFVAAFERGGISAQMSEDDLLVAREEDFIVHTLSWLQRSYGKAACDQRDLRRMSYGRRHQKALSSANVLIDY